MTQALQELDDNWQKGGGHGRDDVQGLPTERGLLAPSYIELLLLATSYTSHDSDPYTELYTGILDTPRRCDGFCVLDGVVISQLRQIPITCPRNLLFASAVFLFFAPISR